MEDFIPIVDLGNGTGFTVLDTLLNTAKTPPDTQKVTAFTAAIEKKTDRPVLVIVPAPVDRVAQALMRGTVPSQAVSEWVTEAQLFLDDALKAWRRILLIDEMALLQASELMSEELGARLGLELESLSPHPTPPPSPDRDLYVVLARYLLEETPALRDLVGQLSSLTLGSGWHQGPELGALDQIYTQLQDQQKEHEVMCSEVASATTRQAAAAAEITQLQGAVSELRGQLEGSLAQLETSAKLERDLQQKIHALEETHQAATDTEITQLRGTVSELRCQLEDSVAQLDMSAKAEQDLIEKLRELEVAQQAAQGTADHIRSDLGAALDHRTALETETDHLYASLFELRSQVEADMLEQQLLLATQDADRRSHTTEMRRLQYRESVLGAEILSLGRENSTLRQSLSTAMTGRDEAAKEVKHITRRLGERDTRIERLQSELMTGKDALKQSAAHITELQTAYEHAQTELEHIYQSKSWKAVSAMRAARHVAKK
ncbi:MAG: hypothetical protein GY892_17715 [Shimia sp.]|nr:hypothetical protein [Shimia sp.]